MAHIDKPKPDNRLAFRMMMEQRKQLRLSVMDLKEALDGEKFYYELDSINNWGRKGRSFPNNPELIDALITILINDPVRRWSADECIRFALLAGQPFDFVERLKDQPNIPGEEYQAAIKRQLAERFGLMTEAGRNAAVELLNKMPHSYIPSPAALPKGSVATLFPRSPFFTGRDLDLMNLVYNLKGLAPSWVVIRGIAGQGKTQFVNEFARCYGQYFIGGVFLVTADTPERLREELIACGGEQGLAVHPGYSGLPEAEQLRLLKEKLSEPVPRLLIIDNADSRESDLLENFIPHTGGCTVLVTSVHDDWGPGWTVVPLRPLTPADSIQVFRRICPHFTDADDSTLHSIAHSFDFLPFAITLAGAFLRKHRHETLGNPHQFYAAICSQEIMSHAAMAQIAPEIVPTKANISVMGALAVVVTSLKEGGQSDQYAQDLLTCAAISAPGTPLPTAWLLSGVLGQPSEVKVPRSLWAGLKRLRDLGLLTAGPGETVLLHRVLRSYVRTQTDLAPMLGCLAQTASSEMSRHENDIGLLHSIAPHLREVTQQALDLNLDLAEDLCMRYGWYASLNGQHEEAIQWEQVALERTCAQSDPDRSLVGEIYCRLGLVYSGLNDYKRSLQCLKAMIEIFEAIYDENNLERALGYQNYGQALIVAGHYEQGEHLIRRSLAIRRKYRQMQLDDPIVYLDIARNSRTLGQLAWVRGRYRRAYWYTWLALRIFIQEQHQSPLGLAQTYHNLGNVLFLAGQYTRAEYLVGKAQSIRQEVYKSREDEHGRIWHHDIAESLLILGWIQLEQGHLDQAEALLCEARTINEVVMGMDSYETVLVLEPLSELALIRKQFTEATALMNQIKEAFMAQFETDVTLPIARTYERQARLALLQGQITEARELALAAQTICQQICKTHPHPLERRAMLILDAVAHAGGALAG